MKERTNETRKTVEKLIKEAFETGDYNFIRKAMGLCSDESGVFMVENDDSIMLDDDIYYFNGRF